MKKINEIFYSLQGEGFWSGTPIIFIRFSGCNLRCDFCDTEHYSHTEMSDAEIIDRIKTFPARRVCLTGGEPSLQIDRFFIDLLHSHGYIIHIETNGTHAIPDGIDWITVSPKTSRIALDRADGTRRRFVVAFRRQPQVFAALLLSQYPGSHTIYSCPPGMVAQPANP